MYSCQRCGNSIADERAKEAIFRGSLPTACSNKCGNALRQQRRRERERRHKLQGIPIEAIYIAEGRDPQTGKQMVREIAVEESVRLIFREQSRAYLQGGALRGRPTALI